MSLRYAQQVADTVTARRRAALERRRQDLLGTPVAHKADIELRNELVRQVEAQIKQLDEPQS